MAILLDLKVYKVAHDSLTIMGMESADTAKHLLHSLYLSNIDTNICERRQAPFELDQISFAREMNKQKRVSDPDEIRLHRLLSKINRNIRMDCITEAQRKQVKRLRTIMHNIEATYYKRHGREIYEENGPAARIKRLPNEYAVLQGVPP